jgi:hypothetical protein
MTAGELAHLWGCSSAFVYKQIKSGAIRGAWRQGWEYRIPLRAARKILAPFYPEILRPKRKASRPSSVPSKT